MVNDLFPGTATAIAQSLEAGRGWEAGRSLEAARSLEDARALEEIARVREESQRLGGGILLAEQPTCCSR